MHAAFSFPRCYTYVGTAQIFMNAKSQKATSGEPKEAGVAPLNIWNAMSRERRRIMGKYLETHSPSSSAKKPLPEKVPTEHPR